MPTIKLNRPTPFRNSNRIFGAVASLLFACIAPLVAHAQDAWSVSDGKAQDKLDTISSRIGDSSGGKNVNANLDAINKKLVIGNSDNGQAFDKDKQPGARVADPDKALPASTNAELSKLDDGTSCKAVAEKQQDACNKIVELQNAKYKYMLLMYETNKKRDDMLRALLLERSNISASDANQYGKLEDNTNKLTALYNLIALDQQQMMTVNFAYDANIEYLRKAQAIAARSANTGKTTDKWTSISVPGLDDPIDMGPALSSLVSGVALKAALKQAKSDTPSGMKRLSIGDSNGL